MVVSVRVWDLVLPLCLERPLDKTVRHRMMSVARPSPDPTSDTGGQDEERVGFRLPAGFEARCTEG